ncbi:peroxiredoxin family protein [Humisphaera borealis]|uniref:Redoxin family protein n=1 Tax=Humisphaera borealis TaxID=2807512 RepID=A0A7M2X0B8_9BACT|nr:peroxiredoxin family protein [Humisphaera borealis]QOV91206.1 redoxin family protein [Humisphaera borealis]
MIGSFCHAALAIALLSFPALVLAVEKSVLPPAVGDTAKNFELPLATGEGKASLHGLTARSRVVLIVLRGWPGYQCPICTKQVAEFIAEADALRSAGVQVLLVYPGPAEKLKQHAAEFAGAKNLPEGFTLVLDPDYAFTNAYGLRWNAAKETAYPSAFVVDQKNVVCFAKVSKSHGGRATSTEVLAALK